MQVLYTLYIYVYENGLTHLGHGRTCLKSEKGLKPPRPSLICACISPVIRIFFSKKHYLITNYKQKSYSCEVLYPFFVGGGGEGGCL